MKKIKFLGSLLLLFTAMTFTSCENEPIDSAINLDDFGNGNTPGVFTAKIGSENFSANATLGDYSDSTFGTELTLTGTTTSGKVIVISITNPTLGTRQASDNQSQSLLFTYFSSANDFYTNINSTTTVANGLINITDFNTTTNKISGTFSFTGYGALSSSTTVEVTNGVLNNISFDNSTTGGSGGGTGGGGSSTIVGTYKLTAFNTVPSTDLNGDGTPHTNQMDEVTCFNNSLLIINSNNTYLANSKGVEIGITSGYECFTDPDDVGTWTLSGNLITFTSSDVTIDPTTFTVSGNTLSYTLPAGTVLTEQAGVVVEITADLTLVYTKQ